MRGGTEDEDVRCVDCCCGWGAVVLVFEAGVQRAADTEGFFLGQSAVHDAASWLEGRCHVQGCDFSAGLSGVDDR